jgi:hypothetical protein
MAGAGEVVDLVPALDTGGAEDCDAHGLGVQVGLEAAFDDFDPVVLD